MATFITSKSVGELLNLYVETTSGNWRYFHNGTYSSIYNNGSGDGADKLVENANGEFTIISCDVDGNESGNIININLYNQKITSFDTTGLSGLTHLLLSDNQLTTLDVSDLVNIQNLYLFNNQLSSEEQDSILNALADNSVQNGNLAVRLSERTSASDDALNTLISTKNWNVIVPDTAPLTFVTSKLPGQTVQSTQISVSYTDWYKVTYWDGTFEVIGSDQQFIKTIAINDTYSTREITIEPCDSEGNSGEGIMNFIGLPNCGVVSFDGSGLKSKNYLCIDLPHNTLSDLTNFIFPDYVTNLFLHFNYVTAESNDLVLSHLVNSEINNGVLYTSDFRTSSGVDNYNTLISRGWNIQGATSLPPTPPTQPVTFITSKSVGESVSIYIETTTGYFKYFHNGVYSYTSTRPTSNNMEVSNSNGEFTIMSCDENGNESGDVMVISLSPGLGAITSPQSITSFDGTGLSGLTALYLNGNQLTSFDGTGLSSLTNLELGNNPLTSFNGGDMGLITSLNFPSSNISTLTGFTGGNMTSLTDLNLDYNQLTSFNGTGLSSLTYLGLYNNQLTSFNGTGLSGLTQLYLRGNETLTTINLSGLTNLTLLDLRYTNIPTLTLSDLETPNLVNLYLLGSNITGLTLSNLSNLSEIAIQGAMEFLEVVSLTNLPNINGVYIGDSALNSVTIDNLPSLTYLYIPSSTGNLTNFSLTNVPLLSGIEILNTQTTSIGVFDIPSLTTLNISFNPNLTSVTLSGLTSLVETYLYSNQLSGFDGSSLSATGNTQTSEPYLHLANNQISNLSNVILNENVKIVVLTNNGITGVTTSDLTGFLNVKDLILGQNSLQSYDFTSLVNLEKISLFISGIQTADNLPTNLSYIDLGQNNISQIDLTNLPNLSVVYLYTNNISDFNSISGLTSNLVELDLSKNSINTIDVSSFTGLTTLNLSNNLLPSIDVSSLVNLQTLDVGNNDITETYNLNTIDVLNVSGLTQLKYIYANWCKIESLDVTGLSNLEEIYLEGNNLTSQGADLLLNSLYSSTQLGPLTVGGLYAVLWARTSNSETAFNELQSNLKWSINNSPWQDGGQGFTFVTSKLPGETIYGYIQSSNGFKVQYWDGTEEIKTANDSFTKTIDINDSYPERRVFLIPFDSNNNRQMGSITFVTIDECNVSDINFEYQKTLSTLSLTNPNAPGYQLTPTLNNFVLSQLAQTFVNGGQLQTAGGRTSAGTSDYNILDNRSWALIGVNLPVSRRVGVRRRNP